MSGSVGQQPARHAADSIYPPANSEPTEYHSGTTTPRCGGRLRGLGGNCRKWVGNMWNYQEILFAMWPSLVIEFGTRYGGSAWVCPGWDVEHRLGYRCQRGCFLGGEHHGWAHPRGAGDAHSRGLPTPVLGTFPAIIDVSELFSGIEIRPHILNAALHPRLIRLFGNERAAVVGGYPRLGSCR